MENSSGKIQVYTGDGKGKTTAALGLAIRALGAGKKVAIVYFDKGGDFYSERKILDRLVGTEFAYFVTGEVRYDRIKKIFRFGVEAEDKKEAQRGLGIVERLFKEDDIDLLVLDEINTSLSLGLLPLADFLQVLDQRPAGLEVVLTGRNAHPEILKRADLVTEMKLVKHYLNEGLDAREGIEY